MAGARLSYITDHDRRLSTQTRSSGRLGSSKPGLEFLGLGASARTVRRTPIMRDVGWALPPPPKIRPRTAPNKDRLVDGEPGGSASLASGMQSVDVITTPTVPLIRAQQQNRIQNKVSGRWTDEPEFGILAILVSNTAIFLSCQTEATGITEQGWSKDDKGEGRHRFFNMGNKRVQHSRGQCRQTDLTDDPPAKSNRTGGERGKIRPDLSCRREARGADINANRSRDLFERLVQSTGITVGEMASGVEEKLQGRSDEFDFHYVSVDDPRTEGRRGLSASPSLCCHVGSSTSLGSGEKEPRGAHARWFDLGRTVAANAGLPRSGAKSGGEGAKERRLTHTSPIGQQPSLDLIHNIATGSLDHGTEEKLLGPLDSLVFQRHTDSQINAIDTSFTLVRFTR
ncbi:hypothetical protein FB45DRAFT_1122120 [Roridomyces roridus]|uniref:Uncharacterized protein n=1 Tax=Roridomyces roridus TaxID=1738132 RepID=A0AAD7B494_9AGAR|nr:hypothetical protein FB45DRAFT_1122120 [Roridomyces roridus]